MPVCLVSRASLHLCNVSERSTASRAGPCKESQQYTVLRRSWVSLKLPQVSLSLTPGGGVLRSMQKRQLFARYDSSQLVWPRIYTQWHLSGLLNSSLAVQVCWQPWEGASRRHITDRGLRS